MENFSIEDKINNEVLDDLYAWMHFFITDHCIYRVAPGEEKLPGKIPGTKYVWQFYFKRALGNPRFLNSLGIIFWSKFKDMYRERPFQVAGMETSASPIVLSILMTAKYFNIDAKGFGIRADRKKYGLLNRFEGIVDYNLPVLLVDDACNSKNHLTRAKQSCEKEDLEIYSHAFVILNKNLERKYFDYDKYIGPNIIFESVFDVNQFDADWDRYQEYLSRNDKQHKPWILEKHKNDDEVLLQSDTDEYQKKLKEGKIKVVKNVGQIET